MKITMRVLCLVLTVLLLSGCGQVVQHAQTNKEIPTTAPANTGGVYIYGGDESIFFAGGKLDELMNLCEEKYIGETDRLTMEDAAAAAIVESLGDRWSYYIPAASMQSYNETMSNSYVGIGITIQLREEKDGFDITSVEGNGPAYEAGIRPGDILVGANGQKLGDAGTDSAAAIIKGEEGTTVDVTVLRDGKEMTFTVERRTILVEVAVAELLSGNVGLVTINNFDARCAEETIACIESMIEQGATSLIFDVRYNPGGYASEMVTLLDYLLPEGEVFISEDYLGNRQVDSSDAKCLNMPMVVLVNGDSYSAAEFFAAALREYEAAEVIGTQTCGKGYYQQTLMLSDGSAVNLSTGRYYTPNGVCLTEVGGLTPDYVVEVDEQTYMLIAYDQLQIGRAHV